MRFLGFARNDALGALRLVTVNRARMGSASPFVLRLSKETNGRRPFD